MFSYFWVLSICIALISDRQMEIKENVNAYYLEVQWTNIIVPYTIYAQSQEIFDIKSEL